MIQVMLRRRVAKPMATITLTFAANGGKNVPAAITQSGAEGKSILFTIPSTKPTRTNYTFVGYATSSSATSAPYKAGSAYEFSADTTLYAIWKNTITFSYSGTYSGSLNALKKGTIKLTTNGTFSITGGAGKIKVKVVGGGGGGAAVYRYTNSAQTTKAIKGYANGGNAGSTTSNISVASGDSFTVSLGAKGARKETINSYDKRGDAQHFYLLPAEATGGDGKGSTAFNLTAEGGGGAYVHVYSRRLSGTTDQYNLHKTQTVGTNGTNAVSGTAGSYSSDNAKAGYVEITFS